MAINKSLEEIKGLIRKARVHKAPRADVVAAELRSDVWIDPESVGTPAPALEVLGAPSILIVWTYAIAYDQFDAFHTFLKQNEPRLSAGVAELGVGATYQGTYVEMPGGNPHHTYWGYAAVDAIKRFKDALQAHKGDDVYKRVKGLISFVKDPQLSMPRQQRAAQHADLIQRLRKSDPIVDLLAGGGVARAAPRKRK